MFENVSPLGFDAEQLLLIEAGAVVARLEQLERDARVEDRHVVPVVRRLRAQEEENFEPAVQLLSACYESALCLAEEHGIQSIGFPSVSTGAFGYPMEQAARIAMRTVIEAIPRLESLRLIRFVLHDRTALEIHAGALQSLAPENEGTSTGS